jgi:protein TonB
MPAHPNIINDPPADPGWTVFANSRGDRTGGIDVASLMAGIPGPPERQVVKQTPVPAAATKPVLIRVSHMEQAQILYKVMPVYPDIARRTRLSGVVNLVGIIATDGSIQSLRVIHGHPFLVNAAVEAVRQWRYKPTILNGQPVEVEAPIDVTFTLQ